MTIHQNTDDLKILSPKFCRLVRFDYSIPTGLQQTSNRIPTDFQQDPNKENPVGLILLEIATEFQQNATEFQQEATEFQQIPTNRIQQDAHVQALDIKVAI